jgi:hypothetical protein
MKKLIIVLICGFLLAPLSAWGQKWIEPYTDKDGTQVEGHWQTPEDVRKEQNSTPGKINPYTGQFNTYDQRVPRSSPQPDTNASSPYAIPGSSAPNPYAIPGSSPNPDSNNQRR